jgi:hypothetical protein
MNQRGAEKLLGNKVTLGADASVAAMSRAAALATIVLMVCMFHLQRDQVQPTNREPA